MAARVRRAVSGLAADTEVSSQGWGRTVRCANGEITNGEITNDEMRERRDAQTAAEALARASLGRACTGTPPDGPRRPTGLPRVQERETVAVTR
ncbi:hypothetical protein GCM10010254_70240 [Streptomyces chromofuscus]|nr:hypothetical protein GCM10010254_70240 [Streptomyces chromofuscus]